MPRLAPESGEEAVQTVGSEGLFHHDRANRRFGECDRAEDVGGRRRSVAAGVDEHQVDV